MNAFYFCHHLVEAIILCMVNESNTTSYIQLFLLKACPMYDYIIILDFPCCYLHWMQVNQLLKPKWNWIGSQPFFMIDVITTLRTQPFFTLEVNTTDLHRSQPFFMLDDISHARKCLPTVVPLYYAYCRHNQVYQSSLPLARDHSKLVSKVLKLHLGQHIHELLIYGNILELDNSLLHHIMDTLVFNLSVLGLIMEHWILWQPYAILVVTINTCRIHL